MANGSWSASTCKPEVWWYGVPGQGSWYWTQRYGQYWVSQTWAKYRDWGFECGTLGPPVKDYGWIAEMNYGKGCEGQWFLGGAIGWHDGRWNVMAGSYGQVAGR